MRQVLSDIRFTLRGFARAPGFFAAAVLTLALGLGANTAMFSVADALILRPLPFRDPGSLVTVSGNSPAILVGVRSLGRSLTEAAAYGPKGASVSDESTGPSCSTSRQGMIFPAMPASARVPAAMSPLVILRRRVTSLAYRTVSLLVIVEF